MQAAQQRKVLVVGAGIGGLSASIRLARLGYQVQVLEARSSAGGLASGVQAGGFALDAGPYILLDKPGLDWAFQQLGLSTNDLALTLIESVYHVLHEDGRTTAFDHSLEATAARFEEAHAGSGAQYKALVKRTFAIHQNLKPFTFKSRPGVWDVLRNGSLQHVPFLLSSLDTVLKQSGLSEPVRQGVSIWTHVSGQPVAQAPSPMAFVPGLFHEVGAYYPRGGMQAVGALLEKAAREAGVIIQYNSKVDGIRTAHGRVTGVQTAAGEIIPADAVVSNSNGIGTYTELLKDIAPAEKTKLRQLPLQSPGVCVYLAVQGRNPPYYIRFKLNGTGCTAFVQPGLLEPSLGQDGWYPARLIAPLDYATAASLGPDGQHALMDQLLVEPWWQENIGAYRVLHRRTTFDWGREYTLYRDSMNPVMTARFMLKGRIAHRSPHVRGLYLAGSSTHPGQWVSFCAISGVLAANCLAQDFPAHA